MADGLSYVPFKPGPGLVEHIALHIEHQIVAGILRSGDRIQETRVVDQLDVSRGSVRESFRVLERRRLIDVIPEARRDCHQPKSESRAGSDLSTFRHFNTCGL